VLSVARHPPGLMVRTTCIARACALASGLPIVSTGVPADSGPAITASAGQPPEDESDGGGKDSRVFFPDPAQYRFDWAASLGGQEGARV
jgi:hypothetical protein